MTREEKISKAINLTRVNKFYHQIFLTEDYLEGTPKKISKRIETDYLPEHKGKSQIWYINMDGIAVAL